MMQVIRQIRKVRDRTIVIHLPEDFPAGDVEVIVLPMSEGEEKAVAEMSQFMTATARFLTRDTSHLTEKQRRACERVKDLLKQDRSSRPPRLFGLFAGLVEIADDFDAPLPDEALFWGQQTDEYGIVDEQ